MLKRLICSLLLVIAAAAFSPLAMAEAANDGIVKFKSAYPMPETIARMKKDLADKGIKFLSIRQSLPPMAASRFFPRRSSSSATRRSARSSSPPIPIPVSIGRCECWCIKMPRATCG